MSLFQSIIIKHALTQLNPDLCQNAYIQFCNHFQDPTIQANIRANKEEQYQEGFLKDLFVQILGYTLNPQPHFNLTTELKNLKGSKKCDGAILKDGNALAVIELKGMNTTDLASIEAQAFGYKNNHPTCRYVITSNFQKLRFYIDNAVEFIEFDLFTLDQSQFSLLYLLLHHEHLLADLPLKLKSESISQENKITHALYQDYSAFKRALFDNLTANNPQFDTLTLFVKTQKLLDRLLFIFFAEDSGLLPANTAHIMLQEWKKLQELKMPISIYDQLKRYFGFLNTGYKDEKSEIFAYNGGLFKPDDILDQLIISDDILRTHIQTLANYNFASEIDVNILGHIFENSLNEIDEIKAQLSGEKIDKKDTKRKKDGVFYTPKYITQYIVQHTVGKLCEQKRSEFGIKDEDFISDKKRQKKTQETLLAKLHDYRQWLLGITICDPACGSGAFLNEALNFLIAEHRYLDELESKLFGGGLVFQEVRNHILENNLFGVDINTESVEIAKLSLWLRTAEPHRKLSNLNGNIKCGNSLIDDPAIVGDKAFNWQKEFPVVFEKGGFDVVIGNPPYVRAELLPSEHIAFYKDTYQVFSGTGDLFSYFYELGFNILNDNGLFGFISNTFDKTTAGVTLRNYIQNTKSIVNYVDFTEVQIFEGATTYPVILIMSKDYQGDNIFNYIKIPKTMQGNVVIDEVSKKKVHQNTLDKNVWSFNDIGLSKIMEKIKLLPTVREVYGKCYYGIKTGLNDAFIIDKATRDELISQDKNNADIIDPIYEGKDLNKWVNPLIEKYIILTHNGYDDVNLVNIDDYPKIKDFLTSFEPKLSNRYDKGKTIYNLRNCAYQKLFYQPKILWTNLCNSNKFSFDDKGYILNAPACLLPNDSKALLAILNSKIVWLFLTNICVVRSGGYIEVKPQYFEQIPVPNIDNGQGELLESSSQRMIDLNQQFQESINKFLRTLDREFNLSEYSKNLQSWYQLDYKDFIKELTKKKIKLSLAQKSEWEEYFISEQQKTMGIKTQIDTLDDEINQMVYALYNLTDDEIALIHLTKST